MGFADDLKAQVVKVFKEQWQTSDGRVVPETDDIQLGNHGVYLEATCLYADLAESTQLVNSKTHTFAAEIYKTFLHCCCQVIRAKEGAITAFDGDRVMAVYIGDHRNTNAARSALAINHAVTNVLNPAIQEVYGDKAGGYSVRHAVGVEASKVLVARTGVRGANDLVWVGRSANYAAKLCTLRTNGYSSFITETVYNSMNKSVKYDGNGKDMWERCNWQDQSMTYYRSSYHWSL